MKPVSILHSRWLVAPITTGAWRSLKIESLIPNFTGSQPKFWAVKTTVLTRVGRLGA